MTALKIINKKENSLLKRKEITGVMAAEKTPSFAEATEEISKDLKADKDLIVIKKIDGGYGSQEFSVKAVVYDSKEDKEKTEKKPKVKATPGQAQAPAPAK